MYSALRIQLQYGVVLSKSGVLTEALRVALDEFIPSWNFTVRLELCSVPTASGPYVSATDAQEEG